MKPGKRIACALIDVQALLETSLELLAQTGSAKMAWFCRGLFPEGRFSFTHRLRSGIFKAARPGFRVDQVSDCLAMLTERQQLDAQVEQNPARAM